MYGKEWTDIQEAKLTTPDTWEFNKIRIDLFGQKYVIEDLSDFALQEITRRATNELMRRKCDVRYPIDENQQSLTSTTQENDTTSPTLSSPMVQ